MWCGVDPGLASMGVAFLLREDTRWRALHVDTVKTDASWPMHKRLLKLHAGVLHQGKTGYPSPIIYAVEEQAGARIGARHAGITNHHADMVERVMGMLWEYVLMCPYVHNKEPLIEVTPYEMRKRVGLPAGATKQQMLVMLREIVEGLPASMTLHAADAVVVALTGEHKYRQERMMAAQEVVRMAARR
jgi:Holliday junction resolvasome RuvABC endonuclease subunit